MARFSWFSWLKQVSGLVPTPRSLAKRLRQGSDPAPLGVIWTLRAQGIDAIVPAIIALTDRQSEIRRLALEAFGYADNRVPDDKIVARLIMAALADKDSAIRCYAAGVLVPLWFYPDESVAKLIEMLETDASKRVRNIVAVSLALSGEERAQKPLLAVIADTTWNSKVRSSVAGARLFEENVDHEAAKVFLKVALNTHEDTVLRYLMTLYLGKSKNVQLVQPLIGLLADKAWQVRSGAADALREIGDKSTVEPLLGILADDVPKVRASAARALGKIGDERAVEPLIAALTDRESDVRNAAASALGDIADPRAFDALITLLTDTDMYVRMSAVRALGKLGDERALPALRFIEKHDREGIKDSGATKTIGGATIIMPIMTVSDSATDAIAAIYKHNQQAETGTEINSGMSSITNERIAHATKRLRHEIHTRRKNLAAINKNDK